MSSKIDIETIVKSEQKGSNIKKYVIWIVIIAVLSAGLWYWFNSSSQSKSNNYITENVQISNIVVTVAATGTVEPTNKVDIFSELSGVISQIEVDYNHIVKKGQILARLNTQSLEANLEQNKAALAARQARLIEAKATYDEKQAANQKAVRLESQQVVSAEQLLNTKLAFKRAEASYKIAEADIRVAKANLQLAEANLDKACICAPIDGIILDKNADIGQVIMATSQTPALFTIAENLKKMQLHVDIDEADIGTVSIGDKAEFSVESYHERIFQAEILELRYSPQNINGVVTYKAILSIDNSDLALLPGMTASANIVISEVEAALAITNAALRFTPQSTSGNSGLGAMFIPPSTSTPSNQEDEQGRKTIWLLKDNKAVAVKVKTGVSDGIISEIIEGDIKLDDLVITDMDMEG